MLELAHRVLLQGGCILLQMAITKTAASLKRVSASALHCFSAPEILCIAEVSELTWKK